jgi:hypothetical protein
MLNSRLSSGRNDRFLGFFEFFQERTPSGTFSDESALESEAPCSRRVPQ